MGSSQDFDEEKSVNGFNGDFPDNYSNQNEYLDDDLIAYINFIDYTNPEFINSIPCEIPTPSLENPESNITGNQTEENDDSSSNANLIGNRRGRETNNPIIQHSLTKNDCRMAKIQTGYFTSLIVFINATMKKLNLNYFFLQLEGKFKSNINQDFRQSLNQKTIKEILYNQPISRKYKNYDKFENKKIIDRLEKENQKIVLDILDKNFLYFFENPFYLSIKKFNLSTFGFEPLEIVLPPKTKMFNDLLEKSNCQDFNEYKYKMEKCAKKYFILSNLSNSIDEKEI